MKYFIKKTAKKKREGPYSKEDLVQLLGSYQIGTKTLCKPVDDHITRFKPLKNVLPEMVDGVEEQRKGIKKSEKDKLKIETKHIILTTEACPKDLEIKERLGIISSESALGMNVFRDLFTNVRDLVGGKSISTQKVLKNLKENAFIDLKRQAYKKKADAVIAVDLDYSEFSGAGRSMLFLVATGTAVKLKENSTESEQP